MTQFIKRSDVAHDHEPIDLVFGPVNSRRFGRSFGISMSYPGVRSCQWSCPYCQLGHWPQSKAGEWASLDALDEALARSHPGDAEVICCSGSGENLDHPDIVPALRKMDAFAKRFKRPLVILTNGDALKDAELRDCIDDLGIRIYVKWDCGVRDGAWRSMTGEERKLRLAMFAGIKQLRLQSMFIYREENDRQFSELAQRWLDQVSQMNVLEIQMYTIDRPCGGKHICYPVPEAELYYWRDLADRRLNIPVRVYASMD